MRIAIATAICVVASNRGSCYTSVRQCLTGEKFLIVIKALDWDDPDDPNGNVKHIARHDVTPQEVEEVLQSAPVFHRVATEGQNPYFAVIGLQRPADF